MTTNVVFLGTIFLELRVQLANANFCWRSVSSSQQRAAWWPTWDLTFTVFYYRPLIKYRWRQAVCPTDFSPNQLLPENINDLFLLCGGDFQSRARQRNRSCFADVHFCIRIDANMGRKMNICIFCSFITQIGFFVIPEICLTASVIHSKWNLTINIERSTLWWL